MNQEVKLVLTARKKVMIAYRGGREGWIRVVGSNGEVGEASE